MKSLLISLLIITTIQTQAQDNLGIMASPGGAPIFANPQMNYVTRNMSLINSAMNFKSLTQVTFNSKEVTLSVQPAMPECLFNAYCIEVMPAPIETRLEVTKIENTACAIVYTAQTPSNVRSEIYEQVVIEDYSYSICEVVYLAPGQLTYKATGFSSVTERTETATATFTIPSFIRAVN